MLVGVGVGTVGGGVMMACMRVKEASNAPPLLKTDPDPLTGALKLALSVIPGGVRVWAQDCVQAGVHQLLGLGSFRFRVTVRVGIAPTNKHGPTHPGPHLHGKEARAHRNPYTPKNMRAPLMLKITNKPMEAIVRAPAASPNAQSAPPRDAGTAATA